MKASKSNSKHPSLGIQSEEHLPLQQGHWHPTAPDPVRTCAMRLPHPVHQRLCARAAHGAFWQRCRRRQLEGLPVPQLRRLRLVRQVAALLALLHQPAPCMSDEQVQGVSQKDMHPAN